MMQSIHGCIILSLKAIIYGQSDILSIDSIDLPYIPFLYLSL